MVKHYTLWPRLLGLWLSSFLNGTQINTDKRRLFSLFTAEIAEDAEFFRGHRFTQIIFFFSHRDAELSEKNLK